ncbi:DUF853 family protein [Saprospiraceae bacterium]|nr:DUF853 family protein [Saprospiraceae bacterium]
MITELYSCFDHKGGASFLKERFFWFLGSEADRIKFNEIDRVSWINTEDLLEARNTKDLNYLVFIPCDTEETTNDSLDSTAEIIRDSDKSYVKYIVDAIFIIEYGYDRPKLVSNLCDYYFNNFKRDTYSFFYKEIDENSVLEYFGILGENKHFEADRALSATVYYKKFISRIKWYLYEKGFNGLLERLRSRDVTNADDAISAFKQEKDGAGSLYEQAKDFQEDIDIVFLRKTAYYRSLIDVDEWIKALEDEDDKSSYINFNGKDAERGFGVVQSCNKLSHDKSNKYLLQRENLECYLSNGKAAQWSDNIVSDQEGEYFEVNMSDSLDIVTAKLIDETKQISLANYSDAVGIENHLDFGIAASLGIENISLNPKLKKLTKAKVEELDIKSVFEDIYFSMVTNSIQNKVETSGNKESVNNLYSESEDIQYLSISDKSLSSGSEIEFIIRTVDQNTTISYVGFQDKEGDFTVNFKHIKDIGLSSILVTDTASLKDHIFKISDINEGNLYIQIYNSDSNISKWIFIEILTEGTKEELLVPNYYNLLQARNDSDLMNKNIQVIKRSSHIVYHAYFNDEYYKINHLPTIFYINDKSSLISKIDDLPVFSVDDLKVQSEFRPAMSDFEPLFASSQFSQYLRLRKKIYSNYQSELKRSNIHSFDEIDISKIISVEESQDYLNIYNALLNEHVNMIWLDMFYLIESHKRHARLDDRPLGMFYSPFHPILLYQYSLKTSIFRKTTLLEEVSFGPNSLASSIKLNDINNWVLHKQELSPTHYISIETDSILFTGFIEFGQYASGDNNLSKILKSIGVNYSPNIGHLSSSQIKSALSKSYSYLSNKTVFNIRLLGNLYDATTNKAILDWVQIKKTQMESLYGNFQLLVNIFDDRDQRSYPDSNTLIYYKEELKLSFNWFKGSVKENDFDLTLVTSRHKDTQVYRQSDVNKLSSSLGYKGIINYQLNKYQDVKVYSDLFKQNHDGFQEWASTNNILTERFSSSLSYNQFESLLSSDNHETEVLAISSDVLNAQMLQKSTDKSLWEFSISDYAYDDHGRGDYFLLAKEQSIYAHKLKHFLVTIDPEMEDNFEYFMQYSKETGLFELKYLISNDNFLKGFIASVVAHKLMDGMILKPRKEECRRFNIFVSYDVFKDRLHKIKNEINPKYRQSGTQFPDFVLLEFGNENGRAIINLRLVEIKYRKGIVSEKGSDSVAEILRDQTLKIKHIINELNDFRTNGYDNGLWDDTLSLILMEFVHYYHENSSNEQLGLIDTFNQIINSDYEFRLNDSLLICVDATQNISSGFVQDAGFYIKIPKNKINEVFNCDSHLNKKFTSIFSQELICIDTSKSLESLNYVHQKKSVFKTAVKSLTDSSNDSDGDTKAQNNIDKNSIDINVANTQEEKKGIIELKEDNALIRETLDDINIKSAIISPSDLNTSNNEVVFGRDSRNRKSIYYPKGRPGSAPLPNYNIMVTGSSGKGKTQFIKSFIYQQALTGTSFTVIDFKNDYSDKYFCKMCNAQKIEVKFDGIPYNPLIPRLGKRDNGDQFYDVSEHINAICSVLGNTFGLGIQQEADLKKAVREVYKSQGINPRGILDYDITIIFPSFNDVGNYLEEGDKEFEKLYNRLDPLFDLNLFRDKYKSVGFTDIIKNSNIIKVADIQNDDIKNAIAKMIIVSAHGYYLGIPHSYSLNKLFVFDEAHRILDSNFVEKFIRECRSFGVGLLLSSQQPDDFPENVLGQLATKVIHGNDGDARLTRKIKSLISFKGEDRVINNLQTFDAIVNSQDYDNWKIDTLAWPQLILLKIVESASDRMSLDDIIAKSKEQGINKDWKDYLKMLIQKDYIKFSDGLYFLSS